VGDAATARLVREDIGGGKVKCDALDVMRCEMESEIAKEGRSPTHHF
jgi:hypothetical protein